MVNAPPTRGRLVAAFAGLSLTAVIWGSAVPVNIVILREIDPFVLTAFRMVISIFILGGLVLWRERGPLFPPGLTMSHFLLLGLFMAGFNVLYVLGVLWSDPIVVSAITITMPLVGSATAKALLGTPLGRGFMVGLVLSILGGLLVVHGRPSFSFQALGLRGGEPLMLLAMVCWNVYSVKAQSWLAGVGQLRLTLISSISTGLWLAVVCVAMLGIGLAHWPMAWPSVTNMSLVVYLALFSAAIGNLLWNSGVSVVGVPVASLYINLSAVFTVLMVMALGIYPSFEQILGGLVVVAGVVYVQVVKLRAAKPALG
ncbi:MAG: DMT family transporter [Rhodospirillales bacterium]